MGRVDRTQLRLAYRPDEERVALERIAEAKFAPAMLREATATARALVKGVRAHKSTHPPVVPMQSLAFTGRVLQLMGGAKDRFVLNFPAH